MSAAAFFNTAKGQALYNSYGDRLHKQLTESPHDPFGQIVAWSEYREAISGGGLDRLPGSGGVYHFEGVARHILAAVDTLIGRNGGQFELLHARPIAALQELTRGYGFRHQKAVVALHLAIEEAGHPTFLLSQYDSQREAFHKHFLARLVGAFASNEGGLCPAAVIDVIRDLAQEVLSLCKWIDRTVERSRSQLIAPDIDRALQRLAAHAH